MKACYVLQASGLLSYFVPSWNILIFTAEIFRFTAYSFSSVSWYRVEI
jgi:hypothetical protein